MKPAIICAGVLLLILARGAVLALYKLKSWKSEEITKGGV